MMLRILVFVSLITLNTMFGGWLDMAKEESSTVDIDNLIKGKFRRVGDVIPTYKRSIIKPIIDLHDGRIMVGRANVFNLNTLETMGANFLFIENNASEKKPKYTKSTLIPFGKGDGLLIGNPNLQTGATLFSSKTNHYRRIGDINYVIQSAISHCVMPNGNIIISGESYTKNGSFNLDTSNGETVFEIFNALTEKFEKGGATVVKRFDHSILALSEDKILVVGGRGEPSSWGTPKEVEIYNPETKTSKVIGKLLQGKSEPIIQLLPDGKVLVMGGYAKEDDKIALPQALTKSAEIFDPQTGTSEKINDSLWFAPSGSIPYMIDDQVVIVSGVYAQGFDTKTKKFYKIADAGDEHIRYGFGATSLSNGNAVVGGGSYEPRKKRFESFMDIWLLEIEPRTKK